MPTTTSPDAFARRYTADEKEAAIFAYLDRGIRPLKAVVAMAERGELVTRDGRKVRPFTINPNTLKQLIAATKRRRQGRISGAAFENPEGTIEALRKRLIALADAELSWLERRRRGTVEPEHMRQIARAIREAAAIPVNGTVRGRAPGEREPNGHQPDQHTRGGMAGALLKAHRARPAPELPSVQPTQAENTNASTTTQRSSEEPRAFGPLHHEAETHHQSSAAPAPAHT